MVAVCILWMSAGSAVAAPEDGGAGGLPGSPTQSADVDRAAVLVQSAAVEPDATRRQSQLDDGRDLLRKFIANNPTSHEMARAEMLLGALLSFEGKTLAQSAESLPDGPDRTAQVDAARKLLREADQSLSVSLDRLNERLRQIPKFIEAGTPEFNERQAVTGVFLQARMHHAAAVEELAATYPADGDDARQLYQAAADRYDSIYRDYRTLIVGLMARLKEGQCYRNLGDTKRALGLYNDLLSQPAELEALRRLRVTAMGLSLECWTTPQEKLHELAFSQGEEYLLGVRPEEQAWPEWQAVRYHTARAYLAAAAALPADRATEAAEWHANARSHAADLAAMEGPYRAAAQALVDEIDRAGKVAGS